MIYAKKFFVDRHRPWWAFWREDSWAVYSHGPIAKCLEYMDCPILRAVLVGEDSKRNAEQLAITYQALWEKGDTLTILMSSIKDMRGLWERTGAAEVDRKIQGGENWPKIVKGVQNDYEADQRKTNSGK